MLMKMISSTSFILPSFTVSTRRQTATSNCTGRWSYGLHDINATDAFVKPCLLACGCEPTCLRAPAAGAPCAHSGALSSALLKLSNEACAMQQPAPCSPRFACAIAFALVGALPFALALTFTCALPRGAAPEDGIRCGNASQPNARSLPCKIG